MKPFPGPRPRHATSAFTLVEMAVVLLVIAAVMGSAIALLSSGLHGVSYRGTQEKMAILQKALNDYRIAYNRLPCPADNSESMLTSTNFGRSGTDPNCTGGGGVDEYNAGANTVIGMVPVRDLGLPDDMAFDGWGRRIRYAAFAPFTQANAFDTYLVTDTASGLSVVNNATSEEMTTTAGFVLVSYGENGHGGRGATTATTVNAGSTNTNEHLNCKCDNNAAPVSSNMGQFAHGSEKPDPVTPSNGFDDIVVFSMRTDLRDADE